MALVLLSTARAPSSTPALPPTPPGSSTSKRRRATPSPPCPACPTPRSRLRQKAGTAHPPSGEGGYGKHLVSSCPRTDHCVSFSRHSLKLQGPVCRYR